jgi:hypothetical protein
MLYTRVKSGSFLSERSKLDEMNSRLLSSAVGFMDAALWLIGGDRLSQAVVMLDNAIEVALKGELERIHKILIADAKSLNDFRTLKSLLKDAFRVHPSGSALDIPDFDIERTIYFDDAFDRVAELYPGLRDKWRKRLTPSKGGYKDSLHAMRNDIVHYGGDLSASGEYAAAIVEIAFPFLDDLLDLITAGQVALRYVVMEWIFREMEVARAVLTDLRNKDLGVASYAIKSLRHQILWTFGGWPKPSDDLDAIELTGQQTEV